jgi:hypothetical protein
MKKCSKCGLEKSLENFSLKHGKCHACRKIEYEQKNNLRKCRGCGEIKPRSNYNGSERYCILCYDLRTERNKESKRKSFSKYRKEHPDKIRDKINKAYRRKYYSNDPNQILNYRLRACRKRAKDKKLFFDLQLEFLLQLYFDQGGRCALTGLPFNFVFDEKFSKRPFSPSIDRINSKLGYTKDNVRLVCSSVNSALSEYGDQIFDIICEARLQYKISEKLMLNKTLPSESIAGESAGIHGILSAATTGTISADMVCK